MHLELIAILFGLAAALGYLNSKLFKLPATIGVLIAALLASLAVVGLEQVVPELVLFEELRVMMHEVDFARTLMHGMLGLLLFAGALHVDLSALRSWLGPILLLATVGTLISTAIVGFGSYYLFSAMGLGVGFGLCLIFGSLISPTDPVAVLGIMQQVGAPPDIEVKVIGESLFNDGLGVVVFSVLVSIYAGGGHGGGELGASDVGILIAKEVGGGLGIGFVGGLITYYMLRSIDEPNLETLISVALVIGITAIGFRLHASVPLACVVAGLFVGNHGRDFAMSDATRQRLDAVWSFVDEALNVVLFLLIGLELVILDFDVWLFAAAAIAVMLVLFARAVGVSVPITIFGRRRDFRRGTRRILTWGGIRGGISIALALSIPAMPGRGAIITVTYVIVVVSVLSQGLSIGWLIEKLVPADQRAASGGGH